jgi:predicted ester cyclase
MGERNGELDPRSRFLKWAVIAGCIQPDLPFDAILEDVYARAFDGTRDKAGVLALYMRMREAFPDFTPEIHWQRVDGDVVTTFKTYHGTHRGSFLGIAGTGTKVSFETVDAMRVVNGKITEHWGVANLYSVMQQLGAITPLPQA